MAARATGVIATMLTLKMQAAMNEGDASVTYEEHYMHDGDATRQGEEVDVESISTGQQRDGTRSAKGGLVGRGEKGSARGDKASRGSAAKASRISC